MWGVNENRLFASEECIIKYINSIYLARFIFNHLYIYDPKPWKLTATYIQHTLLSVALFVEKEQTDGLIERFNQTLKQMLQRFVNDTGSHWDQWLPYLLFAYWEIPQASTDFSPFELLNGRELRSPETLLKTTLEGEQGMEGGPCSCNVLLLIWWKKSCRAIWPRLKWPRPSSTRWPDVTSQPDREALTLVKRSWAKGLEI